jgi:hypothetical protein
MSAIDVVQRQVEAYNISDLNRFVSAYSEAIAIHTRTVLSRRRLDPA